MSSRTHWLALAGWPAPLQVAPKEGDTPDRAKYYQGIKFYDPQVCVDVRLGMCVGMAVCVGACGCMWVHVRGHVRGHGGMLGPNLRQRQPHSCCCNTRLESSCPQSCRGAAKSRHPHHARRVRADCGGHARGGRVSRAAAPDGRGGGAPRLRGRQSEAGRQRQAGRGWAGVLGRWVLAAWRACVLACWCADGRAALLAALLCRCCWLLTRRQWHAGGRWMTS